MYIIPGYVKYHIVNEKMYVSSSVLQNEVALVDDEIQEFYSIVDNGCSSLSSPLKQSLHEEGILADKEEITKQLYEVQDLMGENLLLTIIPTENCNFRCLYCYEKKAPTVMTLEQVRHIKKYIEQSIARMDYVCIGWFGGEPMLCLEIVLDISSFVQGLQMKHNFGYHGQMTTNGFLLDLDCFKKLYNVGVVEYQVTLDGWEHDKTRPHASGKGTLDTILRNLIEISRLPEDEYNYKITIRRNVLDGDHDFSWYDYLFSLFGKDKRFKVSVCPVCDWGGESVKKLNLATDDRKDLIYRMHNEYLDKIGQQHDALSDDPFSHICSASFPYGLIFNANGKIEKCTIALGDPKNVVGRIDSDIGVQIDEAANKKWYSFGLKDECYTCKEVLGCLNLCCRKKIIIDGETDSTCFSTDPS